MDVLCGLQHAFLRSFLPEDLRCGLWATEQGSTAPLMEVFLQRSRQQVPAAHLPVEGGFCLLRCVPPACVFCSAFATQEVPSIWEWHWGLGAVLGSQGTQLAVWN